MKMVLGMGIWSKMGFCTGALLFLLVNFSNGFNTDDCSKLSSKPSPCACNRANGKQFEIYCPGLISQTFSITLGYNSDARMVCQHGTEYPDIVTHLVGMNLGKLNSLTIHNCPIPVDPFATLFEKMGVFGVNFFAFNYAQFGFDEEPKMLPYLFDNLTSLEHLDLKRNDLVSLEKDTFRGVPNLTRLYLSANDGGMSSNAQGLQIHKDIFQNLPNLKELDLSSCKMESIDADLLKNLRKLETLNLHYNNLNELPDGVFYDLEAMSTLIITRNRLLTLPSRIFDNMKNLTEILMGQNHYNTLPEYLFAKNKKLKSINWVANFHPDCNHYPPPRCKIDNYKVALPHGMLHNSTVESIKMLHVSPVEIPEDWLLGCKNLKNITMTSAKLLTLPAGLFKSSRKIENVDFAGNELKEIPTRIFSGLVNMKYLRLKINNLTKIHRDDFGDLRNIKVINLAKNKLTSIDQHAFSQCRELEELQLSDNNLTNTYLGRVGSETSFTKNLEKLKVLNLANNKFVHFVEDWQFTALNLRTLNLSRNEIGPELEPGDIMQFLGGQSEGLTIDISYNKVEKFILVEEGSVVTSNERPKNIFNISGNPIVCDCIATEIKLILEGKLDPNHMFAKSKIKIKAQNLKCGNKSESSLRGMLLENVPDELMTCPFPSELFPRTLCPEKCRCSLNRIFQKTVVNCSGKGLTKIPGPLPDLLNHSETIELNLENNLIADLNYAVQDVQANTSNYQMVTELLLGHNRIKEFNHKDLPNKLTKLNIDHNRIKVLKQNDINYLHRLVKDHQLKIKLGNNPYECSCDTTELYHFLKDSKSSIQDNGTIFAQCKNKTNLEIAEIHDFCIVTPSEVIIASIIIIVMALIAFCALLIAYTCYKDQLTIYLYSKSWARYLCFTEDLIDKDKPYDAFLSYSHMDAEFVERTLLPGMESPKNPSDKYKCLIHTRDWNVGEMIPDQIIHSVESSRRTLIVLSKNYIEAMWTKLEFRAAHTQALQDKTQRVIIVVMGELPESKDLDEDLQKYLSMNTYLNSEDPWFWQKLRYALPHRGKGWMAGKRTRRETDRMELMRAQAEAELNKQSRTPSPRTLNVAGLVPAELTNGHRNAHENGHANGHANGHIDGYVNEGMVTAGGNRVNGVLVAR